MTSGIQLLRCPVCGGELTLWQRVAGCGAGHRFDLAKEGYLNLLRSNKSGDRMGDDKLSARSRRDFLNKGYYAPLKDSLLQLFSGKSGTLLDICCGEGYYTSALASMDGLQVYGFDISREMVRLAAKRGGAVCFVANMASIPVEDGSFDYATHLFAPFHEKEFSRILKPGGRLYSVVPGSHHLFGLKQALYDTPYLNDEVLPQSDLFELTETSKVCADITLQSPEDIEAVFHMTPYYYRTSPADKEKLLGYQTLQTAIEFVIGTYVKK